MDDVTNIEARLNRAGVVGVKRDELTRILSTGSRSAGDDQLLAEFRDLEHQAPRRRCRSLPDPNRELQIATVLAVIATLAVLVCLPIILGGVVDD